MGDNSGMYDKENVINEALKHVKNNEVDKESIYFIRNLVHIITHPEKYE